MSRLLSLARSPYFIGAAAIFFASCMNAMIKGLSVYESVVVITAWRYTLGACIGHLAVAHLPPTFARLVCCSLSRVQRLFPNLGGKLIFLVGYPNTVGHGRGTRAHRHTDDWPARMATHARATQSVMSLAAPWWASQAPCLSSTQKPNYSRGRLMAQVLGYLAPILASLCHALSVVLLRFRSQSEDPIVVAFFANTLPALYVLPVFFLMDTQPDG
jgi:drug/metabolite transporter (DMT)-like permease